MCGYNDFAIFWCFTALVLLVYATAMVAAAISWRRSRFPGWLFIPMALLIICPPFIFPIYAYAEYAAHKRTGNRPVCHAKLKCRISWLPAIAMFVSSWIFSGIEYFAMHITSSDGPVSSTLAYVVALLFSVTILWLNKRLDKLTVDNRQLTMK